MGARIALPAALGAAIGLGVAMSAIVPTRMVTAGDPAWTATADQHETYAAGSMFQFAEAPPEDLDPSLPVGPLYELRDDEADDSVPVPLLDAHEVSAGPVYVSFEYGLRTTTPDPVADDPPPDEPTLPPEAAPLPPQMEAAIY